MRNKFWYLTNISLKKKIKTKWFLIANIFIFLGLILITNIDSIITIFGGEFNNDINIVVIDETHLSSATIFKDNLENTNNILESSAKTNVEISKNSIELEKDKLKETNKILIVLEESKEKVLKAKIISNDYIDTIYYNTLLQALTQTKTKLALDKTEIDEDELNKITSLIDVERTILDEDKTEENEEMSMLTNALFPTIILPFFILVVFLIQMIGAEINEEKQTRSMEVIISNVSPKVHFFSKVLASNIFVLIQSLLLFIYGFIGIFIRINLANKIGNPNSITDTIGGYLDTLKTTGFIDKLIYVIPLIIILMILSFIAYSLVAGILASMTVNMEDFQQIQTPIMLVSIVGYYLAIMQSMFKGSIFIKILSYVPFLSCLLSPALLISGEIGIIDVVIAILILIGFIYIAIKYGLKIYKIGILNYSTDKMWSKLFKAVKQKEI